MGIPHYCDQSTTHALTVKLDEDGLICQIERAFDASKSCLLTPMVAIQILLGSTRSILLRSAYTLP